MKLLNGQFTTNQFKTNQSLSHLLKVAAISAVATVGLTGVDAVRSPVQAAKPADVAQLVETGVCKACDLTNADLTGEHLIGVDLRDADLTGANLAHTNLEGADLTGATLVDTDFTGAYLTNALLDETVIHDTNFSDSTLYYTSLDDAEVGPVNLVGADVLSTPISVGGSYDQ